MERVLEQEVMEGDGEAAAYDELDRKWGDVIFQGFAESAVQMGVREGRALDVGSGPGRVAIRVARLNPRLSIEGIDLSTSMLERATRNAIAGGIANVHFSKGDAKRIPFEDQTFHLPELSSPAAGPCGRAPRNTARGEAARSRTEPFWCAMSGAFPRLP